MCNCHITLLKLVEPAGVEPALFFLAREVPSQLGDGPKILNLVRLPGFEPGFRQYWSARQDLDTCNSLIKSQVLCPFELRADKNWCAASDLN